jgi:hypothetical protein
MRQALVTVSTDGTRDYVVLPDGQRRILGTVSVLTFVTELTPHIRLARQVLNQFLSHGEAMFTIDLDLMDELLSPRRARWSSQIPLITASDRTSEPREKQNMSDTLQGLLNRLAQIESTVSTLDKRASEQLIAPKLHSELRALAAFTAPEEAPVAAVGAPAATPSVEALQANSSLADEVLSTVEQTGEKIDQLVTAGRKFNASAAKDDLYVIASRVAEILNTTDLAQPWVGDDLASLAKSASDIHGLFASAKV